MHTHNEDYIHRAARAKFGSHFTAQAVTAVWLGNLAPWLDCCFARWFVLDHVTLGVHITTWGTFELCQSRAFQMIFGWLGYPKRTLQLSCHRRSDACFHRLRRLEGC
jgi:hypothetical protein